MNKKSTSGSGFVRKRKIVRVSSPKLAAALGIDKRDIPTKELVTVPGRSSLKRTTARKKKMLAALKKHFGLITYAANEVGLTTRSHERWMHKDPDYAAKVRQIQEHVGDTIESNLFKAVKNQNTAVMIFMAKTRLKKRGYVEKQVVEHTGNEGEPIQHSVSLSLDHIKAEVPPKAVENILLRLTGSNGRAEAAIKKLKLQVK